MNCHPLRLTFAVAVDDGRRLTRWTAAPVSTLVSPVTTMPPVGPVTPVPLPVGGAGVAECDLVVVPTRYGLEAVDILLRGAGDGVGPVLHDDGHDTLGFLVPPGTAADWNVPGSTCTGSARAEDGGAKTPGRGPGRAPGEPVGSGPDWLVPPGEADAATDPAVLRRALGEAARLIEAADGCR